MTLQAAELMECGTTVELEKAWKLFALPKCLHPHLTCTIRDILDNKLRNSR